MKTLIGFLIVTLAPMLGWSGELEKHSHAAQTALQAVSLKAASQLTAPQSAAGIPTSTPTGASERMPEEQLRQLLEAEYEKGQAPEGPELIGEWWEVPLQGKRPIALRTLVFSFVEQSPLIEVRSEGARFDTWGPVSVSMGEDGAHFQPNFFSAVSCRTEGGDPQRLICRVNRERAIHYRVYSQVKGTPVAATAVSDRHLTQQQAEDVVAHGAIPHPYQLAGTWNRLPLQGEYPKVLKLTFKFIRKSMLLSAQKQGGLGGAVAAEHVDQAADGVRISWPDSQYLCRISDDGILVCRMVAPNGWYGYATFASRVPLSGMTSEQAANAFEHGQLPKAEDLAGRWEYMRSRDEEIVEPETLIFAKGEKGLTAKKYAGDHSITWPPVDIWPSAEVALDENWAHFEGPEKSVVFCRNISSDRLICKVFSFQTGAYYQVFKRVYESQSER